MRPVAISQVNFLKYQYLRPESVNSLRSGLKIKRLRRFIGFMNNGYESCQKFRDIWDKKKI